MPFDTNILLYIAIGYIAIMSLISIIVCIWDKNIQEKQS